MFSNKTNKHYNAWLFTLLYTFVFAKVYLFAATSGPATFSGELKKWHKVTLTFDGPQSSEGASDNPFTNYRLNVTFTNGSKTLVVPGYFAADGNAANTGATSGNKWRVHLAPELTGRWNYSVSFRKGTNIAVKTTNGSTAGFMDGASGFFDIADTDKTGRDNRAKGRLNYVNGHFLQYAETKEYFIKQGTDSPENLFSYRDFDGGFKSDGNKDNFIKTWQPHIQDWKTGDPTWKNGKGKGLIGAINYLASEGLNAFSFLTMNIEGDDRNVFPYTTYNERKRFDISRLDQWEIVMEHGDKLGMYLHFKTQETENETLLDNGDTGNDRKLYYRELIARFSHHLALNWNLGEENGAQGHDNQSTAQRIAMAQYFYDNDPYQHHIVIHNGRGPDDLLGNVSKLTGISLQTNTSTFSRVHERVLSWLEKSKDAGKPWVVACDEPGDARHALVPDSDDLTHDDARKNALWGTFMAGGTGNEWYFGYQHDHSDLTCQDFRSRDLWWDQCRVALNFFRNNNIPFWEMQNKNNLSSNDNDYCFYKENDTYLVYLKNGGTTSLNLTQSNLSYKVQWFNPRTGGALQNGSITSVQGGSSVSLGQAPSQRSKDWVILVTKTNDVLVENNGYIVIEAENTKLSDNWIVNTTETVNGTNGWTGDGYLHYTGNSESSGPANDILSYKIQINNPGQYKFIMRGLEAPIRTGEGDKANDCYVRVVGQPGNLGTFKKHVLLGPSYNWSWRIKAEFSKHSFSQPIYDLDAGLHTFEIAGRSKNFFIDRVVLYKDLTEDEARELTLENDDQPNFNQAPIVNAGSDKEINLPNRTVQLNGSASDDGLPLGSSLQLQWRKVNGPGTVNFSNGSRATTNATFSMAGEYTLELSATDGQYTSTDRVKVSIVNPSSNVAHIVTQSDAYLQGNKRFNNNMLRIENGSRTSYMKFTVSNIVGQITKATLVLTEGGDTGNGTIQIHSASHNNWSEGNLSPNNAPAETALISSFNGSVSGKQKVNFDVTAWVNQLGTYTFIVKMSGGNDIAFSSKEGNNPPQIIIESELPINQAPIVDAGSNRTLEFPQLSTSLAGSVEDDGLPFGSVVSTWSKASGPGEVSFADQTSASTSATFSEAGTYVLRLSAEDGELSSEDSVRITINPADISVTRLVLIDADTNLDIKILEDGDSINTAVYGSNLNVRADVDGPVQSVRFNLNNTNKTENKAPYAAFGDNSGDYDVWPDPIGEYSLTATPFYENRAKGAAGIAKSIQMGITTAELPYQTVVQLILVNAATNEEIRPLYHGAEISLSEVGTELNVVARVGDGVESVVFDLNNQLNFRKESVAPYALAGDASGDYKSWTPSLGEQTIVATPYSADGGKGAMGLSLEIVFTITE